MAGSREEDECYRSQESLAEHFKRGKKALTNPEKGVKNETKREQIAFADEKQGDKSFARGG